MDEKIDHLLSTVAMLTHQFIGRIVHVLHDAE